MLATPSMLHRFLRRLRAIKMKAFLALLPFALALGLAGCTTVYPTRVELEYHPEQVYAPVDNAAGVAVRVVVRDVRTDPSVVGQTLDSKGEQSTLITIKNDPDYLLQKSMEQALAARGFTVANHAPVTVNLELSQLYSTFQPNWRVGDAHATLVMNAQVIARDGAVTFYQTVSGDGGRNGQDPTGDNRSAGLDQALSRAVDNLADRKDFQRAVIYADRLSPLPVPAAARAPTPRSTTISPSR